MRCRARCGSIRHGCLDGSDITGRMDWRATAKLRQVIYNRLAGYNYLNPADQLRVYARFAELAVVGRNGLRCRCAHG